MTKKTKTTNKTPKNWTYMYADLKNPLAFDWYTSGEFFTSEEACIKQAEKKLAADTYHVQVLQVVSRYKNPEVVKFVKVA